MTYLGVHISDPNLSACPYCGVVGVDRLINKHAWRVHRDYIINLILVDLDKFLISVSNKFISRYKLSVEQDDVVQFLRTGLFLMLRDRYDPTIGKPDYFAKASCHIFLKRFLQEYYYKRNIIQRKLQSYSTDVSLDGDYSIGTETHQKSSCGLTGSTTENDLTFIDNRIFDPLEYIFVLELKQQIYKVLSSKERAIFNYMIDEEMSKLTQTEIAKILGISQPMISCKIKSIRYKVSIILASTNP